MSKIKLQNVRLSFPSLFQMGSFGGESTGKYEATFVLDKKDHAEVIKQIQTASETLMKEAFKGKIPSDKVCLKDGDELGRPEFDGKMTIKASTKKRPLVIDRNKSPITEEDNVVYAGCYVHAIVSLWAQNNQYGKRINAQLDGVQFYKDGEPFGDAGTSADEFDAFGEDDDFLN
jgi:hypothetical protein